MKRSNEKFYARAYYADNANVGNDDDDDDDDNAG